MKIALRYLSTKEPLIILQGFMLWVWLDTGVQKVNKVQSKIVRWRIPLLTQVTSVKWVVIMEYKRKRLDNKFQIINKLNNI